MANADFIAFVTTSGRSVRIHQRHAERYEQAGWKRAETPKARAKATKKVADEQPAEVETDNDEN